MNTRKIGHVVRVGSAGIEVLITATKLTVEHAGATYRIGQLGTYITIPGAERTLVGFITGIGEDHSAGGDGESRLLMDVQLLGEIKEGRFARGVNEYPIFGDEVWFAVRDDFEAIFGSFDQLISGSGHPESFTLGRFALSTDFEVKVLGSEFFAKHAAILGNSGSGKSCTTAKILQEVVDLSESQVVLFDMHGEYRAAFSDEDGQLNANVVYLGVEDLVLPYWLLKYEEIEALFVDRSNPINISTQISFLRTALLEFKHDAAEELGLTETLTLDTPIYFSMDKLKNYAENLNEARHVLNDDHLAFTQLALRSLPIDEQQKLMRTQRCSFSRGNPEGETPHPLYFGKLLGLIDKLDTKFQDRRYEFLLRPIKHGAGSRFFKDYLGSEDAPGKASDLMNHLIKLLTGRIEPRSNLTIVDLSGIPFEIVDITVAVMTRLLFDLNFWTPSHQRHPICLAYEEAHNYIPRNDHGEKCFAQQAVERVAREGRKYGVSALVISQRPSELSETVLSQCNSLVVMRLSNPEDQLYISKVVSDHFSSLIQMLPILRPGEAFVIGDSVLMPMRTLVTLPDPLPQSSDVDFFLHWSSFEPNDDTDEVIAHWRKQDRRLMRQLPEEAMAQNAGALDAPIPEPNLPAAPPGAPKMPGQARMRAQLPGPPPKPGR